MSATLCLAAAPTPWEAYLESPTPQNADKVAEVSYGAGQAPEATENDLWLLAVQVQSADRQAVRLAFRLLRRSDGHHAEILSIMLGRVIRVNPTLFLEELSTAQPSGVWLESLVGNFGAEYVDRMLAHRYEAERRIAALGTVKNVRLKPQREACIKVLQSSLRAGGG